MLSALPGFKKKRDTKGPWQIVFLSEGNGRPYIIISQPQLSIQNCKITFADQKIERRNLIRSTFFDGPRTNAPFGKVVFQDATFLPGTVTFDFWGHGVELMPRALIIDKKEIPWVSNTNIVLRGQGILEPRKVK